MPKKIPQCIMIKSHITKESMLLVNFDIQKKLYVIAWNNAPNKELLILLCFKEMWAML